MYRILPIGALLACSVLAGCSSGAGPGSPVIKTETVAETPSDCRVSNAKLAGTDDPGEIGKVESYKSIHLHCTSAEIHKGSDAALKRWVQAKASE